MHAASTSSLETGLVEKAALQLEKGAAELVADGRSALLVVNNLLTTREDAVATRNGLVVVVMVVVNLFTLVVGAREETTTARSRFVVMVLCVGVS